MSCMFVCLFSTDIQTIRWIWMKFGAEVVLEGGKVLGGSTGYPPLGYGVHKGVAVGCLWSLSLLFWKKLYLTKFAGHPQFSEGRSSVWTPNLDPEGPGPHVLLEPWSFTMKGSS